MVELICENCKYKFKSQTSYKGKPCPYCGEKTVKEEESISDILDKIE